MSFSTILIISIAAFLGIVLLLVTLLLFVYTTSERKNNEISEYARMLWKIF